MDALPPQATAAFAALLGARFDQSPPARDAHATDASHHAARPPLAVAYPTSVDEISAIARLCTAYKVPLIPFGTGTAVEGGIVAVHGGLTVDLSRLNRILAINTADMDATVEAGVTRNQLNDHLKAQNTGLHFPVDPGANASLGGMAATRASGSAAVGYGTMRDNVLGLKAVFADGAIVEVGGRARKSSAGYDLTRLLVGSEGTLALIAEVSLKLSRIPTAVSAAVCPFADIDAAIAAAIATLCEGIPVARLEFLDEVQMAACNQYSQLSYPEAPTLFFEFHGSDAAVVAQAEAAAEIVARHGGGPFRWATAQGERDRLWQARYDAYHACRALRPGATGYVTDVCVPITALAHCIRETRVLVQDLDFPAPLFGHVGDGNYHVVCIIEPGNEGELAQVKDLGAQLVDLALQAGGTCTGEHGIGLGKIAALEKECGPAVEIMCKIKNALDPDYLMNPGKVLRHTP